MAKRERPRQRKLNSVEMKRLKRNRREMQKGNLPAERFLGQMSLDRGAEKLQKKIAKFRI